MNGLKDWIKKQKTGKNQKSIQKPKIIKEHLAVGVGRTETISKVLLDGLYDQGSPLYKLKGCPHIMRIIWENVTKFWEEMVDMPVVSDPTASRFHVKVQIDDTLPSCTYLTALTSISFQRCSFPSPSDININMMPFIVGETFDDCKLPSYVEPYWPMIKTCLEPELDRASHRLWPIQEHPSELGKVNYLTIQESWVEQGAAQRRPGLHVDSPGEVRFKQDEAGPGSEGGGSSQHFKGHRWGAGCAHYVFSPGSEGGLRVLRGGIYLSSSLQSSCRAWNCSVGHPAIGRYSDHRGK